MDKRESSSGGAAWFDTLSALALRPIVTHKMELRSAVVDAHKVQSHDERVYFERMKIPTLFYELLSRQDDRNAGPMRFARIACHDVLRQKEEDHPCTEYLLRRSHPKPSSSDSSFILMDATPGVYKVSTATDSSLG